MIWISHLRIIILHNTSVLNKIRYSLVASFHLSGRLGRWDDYRVHVPNSYTLVANSYTRQLGFTLRGMNLGLWCMNLREGLSMNLGHGDGKTMGRLRRWVDRPP